MRNLSKLFDLRCVGSKSEAKELNEKLNGGLNKMKPFDIDPMLYGNLQSYAVLYNMEKYLPNVDFFLIKGRKNYSIMFNDKDTGKIEELFTKNNHFNQLTEKECQRMFNEMETWN